MKASIFLLTAVFSGVVPGHPGKEPHPLACVEVLDTSSVSYRQGRADALRDAAIGSCVRRGRLGGELAKCSDAAYESLANLAESVPQ